MIDMGWLRLVGSNKTQVSFAEYDLSYRALLQKRPIILRRLLIVATQYLRMRAPMHVCVSVCVHVYLRARAIVYVCVHGACV